MARRGDFFLTTIADESLIVLRDRHGELRAFFNVCRHRGTRLCEAATGHLSETIQCPYHAWTWTTDGRLIGAPHMQEAEWLRQSASHPLHQAGIVEWEGFVFVNLAVEPVPFAEAFAPMIGRLARFGLERLVTGHAIRYEVASN
ncbi:MAG: Rieske (2Fe-2S) protein [Gemmatimonadales bacterium]